MINRNVATKKAILVTKAVYFSIEEHCDELRHDDIPPTPEEYNYEYACRVAVADGSSDLIVQLPDSKEPIHEGDLIAVEFVEIDRDADEVWRLCDG